MKSFIDMFRTLSESLTLRGSSSTPYEVPHSVKQVTAIDLSVPAIKGPGQASLVLHDCLPKEVTGFDSVTLVVTRGALQSIFVPEYVNRVIVHRMSSSALIVPARSGLSVVACWKKDSEPIWKEALRCSYEYAECALRLRAYLPSDDPLVTEMELAEVKTH